jgi:L-aminopeptidase/D-esterase-like protein
MKAGPLNLITDVAGLYVGNAADATLKSGVTAIICGEPVVAAVQVLGGAPGTRETDLLEPHNTVQTVDALVLSGGSGFGLDAASGVQAWLRERGRGFPVGPHRIPIVPAAILFDLANGGDKKWGRYPPYRELGHDAAAIAGRQFEIGTAGAGAGALTAGLKGGLGSASTVLNSGATVGALVAVNAVGSTTFDDEGHFWAAPFEKDAEFGGRGYPATMPREPDRIALKMRERAQPGGNTTIAVIATDIQLGKAEAKRLAISAHDGLARAIWPAHTAMDGDLVFALATGSLDHIVGTDDFIDLCAAAAATMARAVARGVYAASRGRG